MKKTIAIILAMLCLFSVLGVTAFADSASDLGGLIEGGSEDDMLYCIVYQNETVSGVKCFYMPNPSAYFDTPGVLTVTSDKPIAVDHDFVGWRDSEGNLYFAGDKIPVNGEVTLYAVWATKSDNDPHLLRVIKAGIAALRRIFSRLLGIYNDVQEFEAAYNATATQVEGE